MNGTQSGFVALLYIVFLAAVVSLGTGMLVAHLETSGALVRSVNPTSQAEEEQLLQGYQNSLMQWYMANAWQLDSQAGQTGLANLLQQVGISPPSAMVFDMSNLIVTNGIGYHVIALWMPVPGAVATGLDHATGVFHAGTVNGRPANTPFVLVSGFSVEAGLVKKTQDNMNRIADSLSIFYAIRQAADADVASDVNWFRDANCQTASLALACYGDSAGVASAVPLQNTNIAVRIGLSLRDEVTGWGNNSLILVNNFAVSPQPPYQVALYAGLPWGGHLTVQAVSG